VTKRQADYYLHRCYKLLADDETVFRHRKFRGNLNGIAYAAIQGMIIDMRKEALSACTCFTIGPKKRSENTRPGSQIT